MRHMGGVIRNNSTHGIGGGVQVSHGGYFVLDNGTIENNVARGSQIRTDGGGGVNVSGDFHAIATILGGTIRNNSAHSGGGLRLGPNGAVRMDGGIITGNMSGWNEGGAGGGGVFVRATHQGAFNMTRGSITNNWAARNGGGILSTQYSDALTVPATAWGNIQIGANATVSGNWAGQGSSLLPNNRPNSVRREILDNDNVNYRGRLQALSTQHRYVNLASQQRLQNRWAYMYDLTAPATRTMTRISSRFGRRTFLCPDRNIWVTEDHDGIDIVCVRRVGAANANGGAGGTQILSASHGTVIHSNTLGTAGMNVTVETNIRDPITGHYLRVRYSHLRDHVPRAALHSTVTPGSNIGITGRTGRSDGYHLHFDVNRAGGAGGNANFVDPQWMFPWITFVFALNPNA